MTSIIETATWINTELYYAHPLETFFVKSLKPFANCISHTRIADRYYFERSDENGSHVKLYIRSSSETMESIIRPNMEDHFASYFKSQPSTRNNAAEDLLNTPINTICAKPYQDDLLSYSGIQGWTIAQRHFEASSNEVLERMSNKWALIRNDTRDRERIALWEKESCPTNNFDNETTLWDNEDKLSAAIEMNLSMVYMLGMDIEEAIEFFEFLWESSKGIERESKKQEKVFDYAYTAQKNLLIKFHSKVWQRLSEIIQFGQDSYGLWLQSCLYTGEDFRALTKQGVIKSSTKNPLWSIYHQLIQKTNNRIGLQSLDQTFLFYLMKQSLKELI